MWRGDYGGRYCLWDVRHVFALPPVLKILGAGQYDVVHTPSMEGGAFPCRLTSGN